jgi:hypothetical protein
LVGCPNMPMKTTSSAKTMKTVSLL